MRMAVPLVQGTGRRVTVVPSGTDDRERHAPRPHLGHRPLQQPARDARPLARRGAVDVGDPGVERPARLATAAARAVRQSGYTNRYARGPMTCSTSANTGAHASRENATTASTSVSARRVTPSRG